MSNLPYDAEIEYLESSGTQYINTGIYVNANYSVEAVTISTNYTNTGFDTMFGTRNGSNSRFTIRDDNNSTKLGFQYSTNRGEAAELYEYDINRSDRRIWKTYGIYKNIAKIDGRVIYTFDDATGHNSFDYSLFIFALNNRGTAADFALIRYKSLKVWDENDVLIMDLIPVRVGSTGYMYDKVSDSLFGNQGTGRFILGKDKVLPNPFGFRRRLIIIESSKVENPYITDGLVAMWDGVWNARMGVHDSTSTSWADLSGGGRNMTLTQASWDNDSFVVLQSTQNKATIPSSFSYITCEIITKIDWTTNTQYNEAAVLSGINGLGFYSQTHYAPYFSDNSGGGFNNKRFGFYYNIDGGVLGIKNSVQYIVGGNTQDSLPSWKAFFNGEEKEVWYGGWGIGSYGTGINQRGDRRFAGNVYAIRMYNRKLDNTELRHNLIIDNQRFNLGLTL